MVAQLMAQPFKHQKTGGYYYRRVVPAHLRKALGRTEFRISLQTKDLREAKQRYPEKAAEVEAALARAGGGPVILTTKEVYALAGVWYRRMLDKYEAEPGDPLGWDVWADELRDAYHEDRVAAVIRPQVDELLKREGLIIDEQSRKRLDEAVLVNAIELAEKLIDRARGDYSPDPHLKTIPEWRGANDETKAPEGVPVSGMFEPWAAERRFAKKTEYSWKRIIGKLTTHLGHEDAARITDRDIIGWKDALVGSGLSPKTIENHLTIIKTFFRWAAKNKRISTNPAADVEYRAKHDPTNARQSYSDDDAKRILGAARLEQEAHKRWVPWLAAFTGARCDELCGAMAADVRVEDGIHVIRIDPADREEGGSVKNLASIRSVPLHPVLIAEGFLTYVESLPQGAPLFPKLTPDRFGKRGGNGSKTIGRWVRDKVGITDPRKAPNHSWRHRFADQCKKVSIPRELRFALEGHAASDVGDSYGSDGYPLSVLADAITKLPNPLRTGRAEG
jgi:integrase